MKLPDYLLWNRSHRGETLIDLIIGTAILGIIMPILFNALLGILGQSAQTSKMIQANWVANSYMEEVMGFSFDDIDDFDSDTYNEYGLEVAISVEGAVVDGGAGTISIPLSPPVDPDYKQVQVTVSGGGLNENIVLKTLVASEESFGRIVGHVLNKTGVTAPISGATISVDGCASCQYNGNIQGDGTYAIDQVPLGSQTVRVDVSRGATGQDFVVADGFSNPKTETIVRGDNTFEFDFVLGIDIQWAFNNIGTGITNPRGEPAPYPWTQTGGSLTVMFEDDGNCGQDMFTFQDVLEDETNPSYSAPPPLEWPGTWTQTHRRGDNPGGGGQQITQATATITIRGGDHNMRVRWTGIGEAEDPGFDRVGFFIGLNNGAEVEHSRSYAPGGGLRCARMALVETVRCPEVVGCGAGLCSGGCGGTIQTDADGDGWFEMNQALPIGTHTLRIRADSNDGWFHYMSFFIIDVRITKS